MSNIIREALTHILVNCGSLTSDEKCFLIVDETTLKISEYFQEVAIEKKLNLEILKVHVAERHGHEPREEVANKISKYGPCLVIGLTKMSMAHTKARKELCENGGRYLSLPGYTEEMITDPCILVDYKAQFSVTKKITDMLTNGTTVRLKTRAGTDMKFEIANRVGNCCPGFVEGAYNLGSPPDIESNISPIEECSEGVAVIDGSVACDEIGLLDTPIKLKIRQGKLVEVESENLNYVESVNRLFAKIGNEKAYILAECGIGLNPKARLTGNMLTDEGALGCVHLGFGSNHTVGGKNNVPFHVDFVMKEASLWIDDIQVLDAGNICI